MEAVCKLFRKQRVDSAVSLDLWHSLKRVADDLDEKVRLAVAAARGDHGGMVRVLGRVVADRHVGWCEGCLQLGAQGSLYWTWGARSCGVGSSGTRY